MDMTNILLIAALLGSAPETLSIVIDVQTSNCDPPQHRNASSTAQVILIKPSTKIPCTWIIYVNGDNCLEIYANDGADLAGASLEIEDGSGLETRPFMNATMCSSHQVSVYYRHNVTSGRVPGTDVDVYFLSVPRRGQTGFADVRTTTTSTGSADNGGGSNPAVIAVAVIIPLLIISIGGCIFYVWYRRKYPVRMIVGKDFGKFTNPVYNKRLSTATLVREGATVDDYQRDIEEGAAYTGVAHDNPALNMEDDPQYQPIPAMTQSIMSYSNYRRSFDDSPKLEKKAPEKPRRICTSDEFESENIDNRTEKDHDHVTEELQYDVSQNESKIKTDEDSPVYANVETNFIKKPSVNESADENTSGETENDVSPDEVEPSAGISAEYEDVLPTEDEHTYDTALHKPEKSRSVDEPIDDSQIYENLSINGDNDYTDNAHKTAIDQEDSITNEQSESHVDINEHDDPQFGADKQDELPNEGYPDDSFQNVPSTEMNAAGNDIQNSSPPAHLQIQDSVLESLSDESFIVLDQSGPSGVEVREMEEEGTEQNRTHLENGKLEDVGERQQDQSIIVQDDSHERYLDSVDRSFEIGENLNISVSSISDSDAKGFDIPLPDPDVTTFDSPLSDPDIKNFDSPMSDPDITNFDSPISDPDVRSFDSVSSFVSHDLKSIDESSDSFEVISREPYSTTPGYIDDETTNPTNEETEVPVKENLHGDHSDTKENGEQTSSSSKTIKPEVNISFQDSSESEASDNGDEVQNKENSSSRIDERRESLTRKIEIDRGGISFDDSSLSSSSISSDVEDIKPTSITRESVSLDNSTFESPKVSISQPSIPDETFDKSEQPSSPGMRNSNTLDNSLFEENSEITQEPEVSPLDNFHVIEAEPLEQPSVEVRENEPDDKSLMQQRKVLKINMNIDDDLDSDEVSDDSQVRSGDDSNSDVDSSTEA